MINFQNLNAFRVPHIAHIQKAHSASTWNLAFLEMNVTENLLIYFRNKQKLKVRQVGYQWSQNTSPYYVFICCQKLLDYNPWINRYHSFHISHFFAGNWNIRQSEWYFQMYFKHAHLFVLVFQMQTPSPQTYSCKSTPYRALWPQNQL